MIDSLQIENVTKRFGSHVAVDRVSFSVRRGEIVGFVGPNGAGKTTTLRMAAGLIHPGTGQVTVAGKALREHPQPGRVVGFAIDPSAFHTGRSIIGTLRLTARLSGMPLSRADDVMAQVGLESVATRRVGKLSTGMRQRLCIAHAILPQPQFVVFDEPLNGLDVAGVEWFNATLRHLRDTGHGVLLSSHLLSELENLADRSVIVSKGVVVHDGDMRPARDRPAAEVSSSDNDALLAHCHREGVPVSVEPATARLVVEAPPRDVFRLAVAAGVELDVLAPAGPKSLRALFRDLTESEYTPDTTGTNPATSEPIAAPPGLADASPGTGDVAASRAGQLPAAAPSVTTIPAAQADTAPVPTLRAPTPPAVSPGADDTPPVTTPPNPHNARFATNDTTPSPPVSKDRDLS